MGRAVGRFDLGDLVFQSLIVGPRFGKLVINLECELPISLLQIKLRHRLVDERLRPRTREHAVFFARFDSLVHVRAGWRCPRIERRVVIRPRSSSACER